MKNKFYSAGFWSFFALLATAFYLTAVGSGGFWNMIVVAMLLVASVLLPLSFTLPLFLSLIPFTFPAFRPYSDTLQLWRVLAVGLMVRYGLWLITTNSISRESILLYLARLKTIWRSLPGWVLPSVLLLALVLLTLPFSVSPKSSLVKLLFVLNASAIGIVTFLVFRHKVKSGILKAILVACISILCLGYAQYAFATLTPIFDFWQYWAEVIIRNLYGGELASVVWYSNSWFTVNQGQLVLRMFSIMPDSHSFGLICVFGITLLAYFLPTQVGKKKLVNLVLSFLFALGLVFSGTRGVWVGMLVPLAVFLFLWLRKKELRSALAVPLLAMTVVVSAFAVSPIIKVGIHYLYSGSSDDYFGRVRSIYDTNESSNAGRIAIWKESARLSLRYPLGVGFGNFLEARLGSGAGENGISEKINRRYKLPEKYITAHSLYLQTLVELGFVGLILLIWFFLSFLRSIYSSLSLALQAKNREATVFFTSIGFLSLWLMGFSVFDVTVYNDRILVLIMTCFALTLAYQLEGKKNA